MSDLAQITLGIVAGTATAIVCFGRGYVWRLIGYQSRMLNRWEKRANVVSMMVGLLLTFDWLIP
ncbi:MAG: hypothetical protein ACRDWX_10735 [Acidimicrobiia bacterium]